VLKGSYTAISVSVIVHLLLLLILIFASKKVPKVIKQEKPKTTVIKSFLYAPPPKIIPKKVISDNVATEIKPTEKSITQKKSPKTVASKKVLTSKKSSSTLPKKTTNSMNTLPNKSVSEENSIQVTNSVKSDSITTKNKVSGASRGNFSSYDRLSKLREKLANQQREQAFADLTQQRTVSTMDGDQLPVPTSITPLTREEKYQQNTQKSHVGTITKNDDGTCTIYRAQILGSPVEATTSSFACGESKFDKSFREHMQKVQAKLGVKKK
jgi:hypothetical protein